MLGLGTRSTARAARVAAALLLGAASAASAADVTVNASYSANLGGWSIGSGDLLFTLDGEREYNISINAGVSGIAALVASRSATATVTGRAENGANVPRNYLFSVMGGAVTNTVEMGFSGSAVRSLSATELRFASNNDRVPLLPRHKQDVIDPIGGFVMAVPPSRDPMARQNCNRTIKVFDGRVRYDLRLTYGATSEIRADGSGYSGPALICAVAYRPIAGQRILSPEQQKFENNLEFSIWYVPVGDTGVLLPHRVVIGTPMGLLTVSATRFNVEGSMPVAVRTTPRVKKAAASAE